MRAVRYGGMDPDNWPGSYVSAYCHVCGEYDDLVLRGRAFECRVGHAGGWHDMPTVAEFLWLAREAGWDLG